MKKKCEEGKLMLNWNIMTMLLFLALTPCKLIGRYNLQP
jgi:hypothetical protein